MKQWAVTVVDLDGTPRYPCNCTRFSAQEHKFIEHALLEAGVCYINYDREEDAETAAAIISTLFPTLTVGVHPCSMT